MEHKTTPKVSFIIPTRNEERYIRKCLDSILALDYPKDKIEILIAEGNSTDKTEKIIREYMAKHDNIKLLKNPAGNTAIGRNLCIDGSTGDMLMNYSGHAIAEKDLLRVVAFKLAGMPEDVAGVGISNVSPPKQNFVGEMANTTFRGFMAGAGTFSQNAVFDEEKFVDHMAFTCYRREIFDIVGKFDSEFRSGQDAELDIRIKKAGYKILYTPKTRVYLFKRDTIRGLFRQLYRYSIARVKMIKKYPDTMSVFHLLPPLFIIGVIAIALLWIIGFIPGIMIIILIILYAILCIISSLMATRNPIKIAASIFFYLLIQVAYGVGFIRGIFYGRL